MATISGNGRSEEFAGCIKFIDEPIIVFSEPFERPGGPTRSGGCEDPRAVTIDDEVYMTFVAFDGWGFVRVTLTSILKKDFLQKEWAWRTPALLSPREEGVLTERLRELAERLRAAIEEVLVDDDRVVEDIFEVLSGLVDKSLVVVDRARPATRYDMLETVRQYAHEHLLGSP